MIVEKSDVLIIGSGGAGLRSAIELKDNKINVLVVGKCKKRDAHTILATGGINAALGNIDKKDNWKIHAADTIRDGSGINDTEAVKVLCKNAPLAIKELDRWGTHFNREKNGKISQRFFGASSYRRACFSGDYTGREILNTLVNQVLKRKIRFKSEVYIFSLLFYGGKVNGAVGLDIKNGKIIVFHSKIVILAAGGHSRMFARSSSRFWENNGDGIYLACTAGARFMDMEMFQFHPTGMVWPEKASGTLVTEAIRGEGGILTNSKGERFMEKYDKDRLELSARDIVTRAIYTEVLKGNGTKRNGVYLDISHKSLSYIKERLPRVYKQFKEYAKVDISKEKMEVAPTAHYSMGGIFVDHRTGRTDIDNLYAIGEVTSGVHGGNRLGGNSLAEILVFGRLTGNNIAKKIKKVKWIELDKNLIKSKVNRLKEKLNVKGRDPIKVKEDLQKLMWKNVGVIRNGKDMKKALKELKRFRKIKLKVNGRLKMNKKLIAALDIQNMIPTCEMIIISALERKESRGAHYRSDYKKTDRKWKKNIICKPTPTGIYITTNTVKKVPKEIQKYLKTKLSKVLLE